MPRIAFYTLGVLREDPDHPASKGFRDRGAATYESATLADGFCSFDEVWDPAPRFIPVSQWGRTPQTLSTWRDLESVFAFAYNGRHGEALRGRREWFLKLETPVYAIWWVEDDHQPDFAEAFARVEHLHACGPQPHAFNFRQLFDAAGERYELDREMVTAHRANVR